MGSHHLLIMVRKIPFEIISFSLNDEDIFQIKDKQKPYLRETSSMNIFAMVTHFASYRPKGNHDLKYLTDEQIIFWKKPFQSIVTLFYFPTFLRRYRDAKK